MPADIEKAFIKAGKPYAKGGPASKRRKKPQPKTPYRETVLKQTRLPISPLLDAKDGRSTGRSHRTSIDQIEPVSDDRAAPASTDPSVSTPSKHEKTLGEVGNDEEARDKKHSKQQRIKMSQSKINFEPGGDRYISTEPMDSEEEEFRGTQFVTQPSQNLINRESAEPLESNQTFRNNLASSSRTKSDALDKRRPKEMGRASKRIIIESDSEEELVTPLRRRQRFMPARSTTDHLQSPSKGPQEIHEQELESEARDLDNKLIKTTKLREGNTRKNAFRDNLERLRRKKAGLASQSEDDSKGNASSEQESEKLANDEPEDWIVEDDFDRNQFFDQLPTEFQQPRQPMEQFKIAVQWEILDLLLPQGGLEPDAYFRPAIRWLRDRTSGKSQAAISSIWRRPFVKALQRGPDLNAIETGNLGFFCDACGRTNRVATYVVKFEGSRYDRMTLEDLDTDASSSEDDLDVDENAASDLEVERARKERILRAEWNLGVNCYERTCVAHELFHLRKHLREEIYEKLKYMGLFTAAKKVERSVMSRTDRIELANELTEELDRARFQQRLWSRYKATIEKNEDYIVDPGAGRKKNRYG